MTTGTNCPDIVLDSLYTAKQENLPWTSGTENILSEIGLRQSHLDNAIDLHLQAFQRLQDIHYQNIFSDIKREDSKLRTYSKFKTEPRFEKYLDEVTCVKERITLTKLRLSNQSLMIEKGRHMNIDKTRRFCPFYPNSIEDKRHFLIQCKQNKYIRQELLEKARIVLSSIFNQCYDQRFLNLISKIPISVSHFIFKAMELREFLMAKPRNNN